MVAACKEMAVYCFDVLLAHYTGGDSPVPCFEGGYYPLFVTWKKALYGREPRLRGCIGTLEARCVLTGFKDYALTRYDLVVYLVAMCTGEQFECPFRGVTLLSVLALRDRRFPPIQAKELPTLEVTVSLLTDYEVAGSYMDWEVGKHGMILEFNDPTHNARRSATYLPEVAAQEGWSKLEAVDSLVRKAGYNGPITESLREKLRVTRYQSSLFTLHFGEYVDYVQRTRGYTPKVSSVRC